MGCSCPVAVGTGVEIRHSSLPFPLQLWCERVNPENKAALEAWVRETGIRLVQVNGQRKYGGPPPGTVVPALRPSGSTSLDGPDRHRLGEGPAPALCSRKSLTYPSPPLGSSS